MLRVVASLLVFATAACFSDRPLTWNGRHQYAIDKMASAHGELERFYQLTDAAKAAVEIGGSRHLGHPRQW